MKLIMEGWKTFLKEGKSITPLYTNLEFLNLLSQVDNLDEASWKKRLAGLGLAGALGVGGGAGIGSALTNQDGVSKAPTSQVDTDGGMTSAPSFGKSNKQSHEMPLDMEWARSPTAGNYVWVSPEQLSGMEDDYVLPMASQTVNDYRAHLSDWSIEKLYKLLYKDSGVWGYTESSFGTFDNHPKLGLQMLPPDWSIAFDVYKGKIETATDHIQQQIKNSNDGGDAIAKSLGHEGVEGLRAELEKLTHSIQY
tara:strand:+ start:288 stop:1040 length:753 start_codon:yes stop_codon:yes gene_type:complete